MQKKLFVYVGSESEHKLKATREACAELGIDADVIGVKVPSGVNEQPVKTPDKDEIRAGAYNRALGAFSTIIVNRDSAFACDIAIGIENGIEFTKGAPVNDFASIVVLEASENVPVYFANSAAFPVSRVDVQEAQRRGFDKHTVASVTAERTGCDATDATPYYTGGRMNRAELLKQAIRLALCQWLTMTVDKVAP